MLDDTLRDGLVARLPANPHPLAIARIDDIASLSHLVGLLEQALAQTSVITEAGAINPLVEAIGKNRERLRRAMNDLQALLGPPARTARGAAEPVRKRPEKNDADSEGE